MILLEADKQNTPTATNSDGKDKDSKDDLLRLHRAVLNWQVQQKQHNKTLSVECNS